MKNSLVLIPGLMCDASVWAHQRQALADIADIHIADNGARDSLAAMAQAIIDTAPARFALAGHSMGGRVAIEVMRRVPERVQALALLDTGYQELPAGEHGQRERASRLELLERARARGMRAMGKDWVRGMVHPARLNDEPLVNGILEMIGAKSVELYAAQIQALLTRPDASELLPQIRCPALVLVGREDTWAPVARHQQMASLIPGATLTIVPECGHMCTLEQPEAVSGALRAWLMAASAGATA